MLYFTLQNSKPKTKDIINMVKAECGKDAIFHNKEYSTHIEIHNSTCMIINTSQELVLSVCSDEHSKRDYKISIDLKDINTLLEMY